jgi:hypothetical protein
MDLTVIMKQVHGLVKMTQSKVDTYLKSIFKPGTNKI